VTLPEANGGVVVGREIEDRELLSQAAVRDLRTGRGERGGEGRPSQQP